jgi:hypothetical protein
MVPAHALGGILANARPGDLQNVPAGSENDRVKWQPTDSLHAHALGVSIDGEMPEPMAKQKAERVAFSTTPDGIQVWVPFEDWEQQYDKRESLEAEARKQEIRTRGMLRAMAGMAIVGGMAWFALIWIGVRWLAGRFGG